MNNIKILIVEDETIVALDIRSALKKLNYEVTDIVTNYEDALLSVQEETPNIVLMDIHLEDSKDGIETAHAIQKINPNIPIIYLTAFSDDKTIKRAIQTNPLGYLIKPFKREELKTTIFLGLHKINQTQEEHKEELIQNSDYKKLGANYYYDCDNAALFYNDVPVKLSHKESLLVKILIEANGQLVPFKDIEYQIWPDDPISNSTLRTLIYRTRAKLEYKFIETIPSFGCQFLPEL